MKYLLTCSAGLESLAKKEILKDGGEINEVYDRLCFFSGDLSLMAKLNLNSRVGNKLYLVLTSGKARNFDELFALTESYQWKHLIKENAEILVKATQVKSNLTSTPVIQKIVKKAIVKSILPAGTEILREDPNVATYEIFAFLYGEVGYILLNTTGETLYKRGYRTDAGEAPIKESLAAALVTLAHWDFRTPLFDICCGSGTIAIEAAMMARNIAPGLTRRFAFEPYDLFSPEEFAKIKAEANDKIFHQRYMIIATDIDPEILAIAEENAKNAGVLDTIRFGQKDLRKYVKEKMTGSLISNPPYGLRLGADDLKGLYKNIASIMTSNPHLNGGIITSYLEFDQMIPWKQFKKRKLYNGNELCYFYYKKMERE